MIRNPDPCSLDMIKHMTGISCPYKPCHMKRPSRMISHYWIYEDDPARQKPACRICPHPKWKNGQWMMFFDETIIDEKWDQAVDLYRRGKLFGVQSMRVSTAKSFSDMKRHVLIFECGPSDHKNEMMEIGHHLLDCIYYNNFHGAMFFTENKDNGDVSFKYKINLPRYCDCDICIKG